MIFYFLLILFRLCNNQNEPVGKEGDVFKLTAKEGIHSLACRTRKTVNEAMKHLAWIVLGNCH